MADERRNILFYEKIIRSILKNGDKRDVNKWEKSRLKTSTRKDYEKAVIDRAKELVYAPPKDEEEKDG